MKYAFNTWAYGSFPSWLPSYELDEVVRRLARIGYDGIEIGCAAPHAWPAYLDAARRRELRSLMEGEGLPAVSLLPAPGGGPGHNPASPLEAERRATMHHYCEVIDLAADLGAGLVLYIAGWQVFGSTREDAYTRSVECLRQISKHAEDCGIVIAIEPTAADSNLIDTPHEALKLMRDSGAENVKVMFDTYHAIYRDDVSADHVRILGDDLVHIHCADANRAAPGDGVVDWFGVLQAARDIGFAGYLTMEIGFHTREADPDNYARRALSYLKGVETQLS
ncbi:sugar phosphate isomerase/epimerase family protein [Nitratireductor kimnyeongensis]|uniref:Sugar phosphate isomerase/epimerase family protein n=1 Tax=Nitratireductor kimnyeongensis TaxID=430679 RepID=A0ABW0TCD6_9HYPH|nr:sugar phosphate isomerase/epimerase family protein [Nitratireductor kimnyeongensis]QZZ36968.1 sugar phosphate isomerase/epimerase [Nitratireductor kimnyeongensis]